MLCRKALALGIIARREPDEGIFLELACSLGSEQDSAISQSSYIELKALDLSEESLFSFLLNPYNCFSYHTTQEFGR